MFFMPFTDIQIKNPLKSRNNISAQFYQRKMKFIAAALLLFSSLAVETNQYCSGLQKQDLLQSGTVELRNSKNVQETCYDIKLEIPATAVGGLGVAVSAVNLHGYRPSGGLDYSVRGGLNEKQNGISLSLLVGDKSWSKVTASYLISSRKDVIAGSFIADTFELFGCDNKRVDNGVIKHSIPHFPTTGKYQVATFISGVKTLDRYMNARIHSQTINNFGDIQIKITSNANPSIQNVYINYIAWERRAPFSFRPFSGIGNADGHYNFAGIKEFKSSLSDGVKGIAIFTSRVQCVGSNCPAECLANEAACKRIGGEIINGICVACGRNEKYINGKCVDACGRNQVYRNGKCVCREGHVLRNNYCTPCPSGSEVQNGKCVCTQSGYWFDEQKFACLPETPSCPPRSKWNQKKLQCECLYSGEYLIGNICRKCGPNEGWNGEQCVCSSEYYRVKGVCQRCQINSSYNGRECVCNIGFYENKGKCEKCHVSCGKCKGPGAHQCVTCTDVSYTLKNGYCTRGDPCPTGLYLDERECKPCSSYCESCSSDSVCNKCIDGFQLEKANFFGKSASYCTQICGDGKRFEIDCDDGNKRNGDGCNSNCEIQSGYTCQGGSSVRASTCVAFAPERSYIQTKGTTHLFGRIVQGLRLSYIPPELTKDECALCSKLLWVRVIDSSVVPGIRVNYLPKSKYQFLTEFEFNGLFSIPVFTFSVQINPDYARYFSKQDMAQIEVKKIDPALLKVKQTEQTLSSFDVYGNNDEIDIKDEYVDDIFK